MMDEDDDDEEEEEEEADGDKEANDDDDEEDASLGLARFKAGSSSIAVLLPANTTRQPIKHSSGSTINA
jgi:hypothetical protein